MAIRRTMKGDNFDSVLDFAQAGRPAKLRIRFKVTLIPKDPTQPDDPRGDVHFGLLSKSLNETVTGHVEDGDQNPFKCRSWTEAEFNEFKIKFKRMVELSWNNQLILLPPDTQTADDGLSDQDYMTFVSSPQIPAHVECALEVELMPSLHPGQNQIEVARLAKRENHAFRSFRFLITNEDIEFHSNRHSRWPGLTFNHVVAAHEVGHWLGAPDRENRLFPHIDDQYCSTIPEDQRDEDCEYGHVAGKRQGLMGDGDLATEYEAKPWLYRIQLHSHALFGWQVVHRVHFDKGEVPVSDRQRRLTAGSRTSAAAKH
jgi:hypothetical protein